MGSNLDALFKTNSNLEKNGIEFVVSEKTSFTLKRWKGIQSFEVQRIMANKYKPFIRQMELGTLSEEKSQEIIVSVFVDCCMVGWKGIEIDGKDTPFSREAAITLLKRLPDLCDTLISYSSDVKNYREELGNS